MLFFLIENFTHFHYLGKIMSILIHFLVDTLVKKKFCSFKCLELKF